MKFEIRVFNERFNVDSDYYKGDEDIKFRLYTDDPMELLKDWFLLEIENEGETYSVWKDGECIVGGAYDLSDWEYIAESLGYSEEVVYSTPFYKDWEEAYRIMLDRYKFPNLLYYINSHN